MEYSKKLITEVKRLYPNVKEMHLLAETGHIMLGRWLDDSSEGGISFKEILQANSLQYLHQLAKDLKEKKDLYTLWNEEYNKHLGYT